jgi:hypothetical protein
MLSLNYLSTIRGALQSVHAVFLLESYKLEKGITNTKSISISGSLANNAYNITGQFCYFGNIYMKFCGEFIKNM